MKFCHPFSFLFCFLSFQYTTAQVSSDTVELLQEVTVSATKDALPLSRLPYAVVVRKKESLASPQSRTVPEALSGITGLFIQKTNHAGGSPFLRGLTGNQSLIMMDGVRLNNSIFRYGPNQYLTLVNPAIVDRIEVVKGTGAVQYGSDAMTGVIFLQTQPLQFSDRPKWNGISRIRWTSSEMEWSVRPEVHYSGKRVAFIIGGGNSSYGDLRGGDTSGYQRPSGYREGAYDMKMQLDLGADWLLTAATQWLQQSHVPVYHKYVLENFAVQDSDPISRGLSYLKLTKTFPSGDLRRINIIFSSQRMQETRYSRKNTSILTRREQDRVSTKGLSIDLGMQHASFWRSNSGVEFYSDKINSFRNDLDFFRTPINELRGLYPNNARYMHASLYSLHHLELGRVHIESGVRQTFYRASLNDVTVGKVVFTPKAFVLQAGLSYRLSNRLYLFAHASEGFRAANIDDLGTLGIVDFRYEIPAYDLRPERSLNQEGGLKYHSSRFNSTISFFRVRLTDLITRIKTAAAIAGYDVYTKVNVDKGYIRGFEGEINYQLLPSLRLQGGISYLYGQSTTRNEPLRRIPPFYSRISVAYLKGKFSAAMHIDHAGKQSRLAQGDREDNRIPLGGTPAFTVLHLQAGASFERAEIRMMLHNLFNADYRLHGSGINGMGRAISLGCIFSLH